MFSVAIFANAQPEMRNTVTFSGGFAHNVGNFCCGESAPFLAATYSYRLLPHLDLEAGVDSAISLGTEVRGATYDIRTGDRLLWVPFGIKGVLPTWHKRAELFAGAGGLYEKYLVGNPADFVGISPRSGWGGYAAAGAALALDRGRHYWLGGSSRLFFANTSSGYSHDRWFAASLDFGFRF